MPEATRRHSFCLWTAMRKDIKGYPGIVVADAGYGSYDNYMYCLEKDIEGYLKYQNYRYEKTAKFKKDIYRKENLLREENGKLICPQGREFVYKRDSENTKTDYPCITQVGNARHVIDVHSKRTVQKPRNEWCVSIEYSMN